jgi:tetratricopeptide (TPR) repeat protein
MNENKIRFQEAMEKGHNAAWDQDWQGAANYYLQALAEDPGDPNALVSLGLALYEQGLYDQSLDKYSQAQEISPENPLPFEKTSQLYELLGRYEEVVPSALKASELYLHEGNIAKSVECLVRINRVDAANLPAHSRLALIYEKTGRKQQAVTEFLIVASLLQHQGDTGDAQQAVEHALSIQPSSREAKDALALIVEGVLLPLPGSSKVEAIEQPPAPITSDEKRTSEQKPVLDLDPIAEAHQAALSELANLVIEQSAGDSNGRDRGDQERSEGGSIFNLGDQEIALRHLQAAVISQGRGDDEDTAADLQDAINAGLDHPAAYFDLGLILSKGDRLESALRYLQRSIEDDKYVLAARILIARNLRFKGKLNEAATNYLEALRIADASILPEEQREDMLRMYGPVIEAESKQSDAEAKNGLCDLIEELLFRPDWKHQLAVARGEFQIDVDGAPSIPVGELLANPQGHRIVESVRTINQYARTGYLRSAMEEAYFAIQFAPTYLALHTFMGELLLKQEHLKEAIEKFSTIAQTYRSRGEIKPAVKILQRVIKAAPMDLESRTQLISLYKEINRYDQVIKEKVNLAGVYYNLADLARAREVYLDAFQLAQSKGAGQELRIEILHNLADIEMQSLDWKHAEEIYEQIRSIKPDDPQAAEKIIELKLRLNQEQQAEAELQSYLSFMDINGNNQAAISFIGKLVEDFPDRRSFREMKAGLYLKEGQREEAIREFDAIGEMLLEAGDTQGALQAIESIVNLNPPNKDDYQGIMEELVKKE